MQYFIFILPAMLLAMYAQYRVKAAFNKYAKVPTMNGMSGAQVARQMLDAEGLYHVKVEAANGFLTDHYDPRGKVLRLSEATYASQSVAAAGIAAHEMGHALQDNVGYLPLKLRSGIVPAVQVSSRFAPWIFMAGMFLQFGPLAWVGIALFAVSVIFSLVTLPVEFDASNRAKKLLVVQGIVDQHEMEGVNKVLNAAALTYVAAAIQALVSLLYYVSLLNRRR